MSNRGFRLAGLLKIRKLQEDQAKQELAVANVNLQEKVEEAGSLEAYLRQTKPGDQHRSSLAALAASRAATTGLLTLLDLEAQELGRERDRAGEAYREARMRSRGLEKLEGHHEEQVAAEELVAEQVVLDEAAAASWAARRSAGGGWV